MSPEPTHQETTSPGHGGPLAVDALIHSLAEQLADELAGDLDPALVHVAVEGDGHVRLGLLPLEGRHPSELLLGFTAPADWHALGMATSGWAYRLAERGSPRRTRTRIRIVALQSRSGELARRIRLPDGADAGETVGLRAPADGFAEEELTGEQVDLLRLALGLVTEPPPCGSEVFWTIEWLSALAGTDPSRLRTWEEITDRHPAMVMLRAGSPESLPAAEGFVEAVSAFARVCSWSRLRSLVADGRFEAPELTPADARWLDDGAFARFVLSRCPPLDMLRGQVSELIPHQLARRLSATLTAMGVPRTSWPDDGGGGA